MGMRSSLTLVCWRQCPPDGGASAIGIRLRLLDTKAHSRRSGYGLSFPAPDDGTLLAARLLHAPVDVRRIAANRGELGDPGMVGREMADRVGRARVAGEREGLTAAAAEILLASRAARARLLHPGGATERVERRRVRPDIGERMIAHVPELETGNRLRCMAGQHFARRRHVE